MIGNQPATWGYFLRKGFLRGVFSSRGVFFAEGGGLFQGVNAGHNHGSYLTEIYTFMDFFQRWILSMYVLYLIVVLNLKDLFPWFHLWAQTFSEAGKEKMTFGNPVIQQRYRQVQLLIVFNVQETIEIFIILWSRKLNAFIIFRNFWFAKRKFRKLGKFYLLVSLQVLGWSSVYSVWT